MDGSTLENFRVPNHDILEDSHATRRLYRYVCPPVDELPIYSRYHILD